MLARHGLSFRDIRLIVVTHAHTDHAGSAARLRALSGAPILAHEDDADVYSRRVPMTFCPTGRVGRLFLRTPLPHQPYEGFEPDIMMRDGETVNLLDFGVDGVVRHTGGHTPGSIAIELSSQDALVGDLVASGILIGGIAFTGRAIRPPFEDDPHEVARELERIVHRGPLAVTIAVAPAVPGSFELTPGSAGSAATIAVVPTWTPCDPTEMVCPLTVACEPWDTVLPSTTAMPPDEASETVTLEPSAAMVV